MFGGCRLPVVRLCGVCGECMVFDRLRVDLPARLELLP